MDELQQQIVNLVQAAMSGDEQAAALVQQIQQAAQEGDEQATQMMQMIQQVVQQMQQVQSARMGGKIQYIRYLRKGGCMSRIFKGQYGQDTEAILKDDRYKGMNKDSIEATTKKVNDYYALNPNTASDEAWKAYDTANTSFKNDWDTNYDQSKAYDQFLTLDSGARDKLAKLMQNDWGKYSPEEFARIHKQNLATMGVDWHNVARLLTLFANKNSFRNWLRSGGYTNNRWNYADAMKKALDDLGGLKTKYDLAQRDYINDYEKRWGDTAHADYKDQFAPQYTDEQKAWQQTNWGRAAMAANPEFDTIEKVMEQQRKMRDANLYHGAIDGKWGRGSQRAWELMNRNGGGYDQKKKNDVTPSSPSTPSIPSVPSARRLQSTRLPSTPSNGGGYSSSADRDLVNRANQINADNRKQVDLYNANIAKTDTPFMQAPRMNYNDTHVVYTRSDGSHLIYDKATGNTYFNNGRYRDKNGVMRYTSNNMSDAQVAAEKDKQRRITATRGKTMTVPFKQTGKTANGNVVSGDIIFMNNGRFKNQRTGLMGSWKHSSKSDELIAGKKTPKGNVILTYDK